MAWIHTFTLSQNGYGHIYMCIYMYKTAGLTAASGSSSQPQQQLQQQEQPYTIPRGLGKHCHYKCGVTGTGHPQWDYGYRTPTMWSHSGNPINPISDANHSMMSDSANGLL